MTTKTSTSRWEKHLGRLLSTEYIKWPLCLEKIFSYTSINEGGTDQNRPEVAPHTPSAKHTDRQELLLGVPQMLLLKIKNEPAASVNSFGCLQKVNRLGNSTL